MSSPYHHPYQNPNPNPKFDEQRWIIQIRQALEEEDLDVEFDIPISIFNVPKSLILISPESYIPQQIALGPYHHSRPELYEMERYKLASAKRSQKNLQGLKFGNLVDRLNKFDLHFRACYQKFLDLNGETLAWMMAVDSCFLLEFLQVFSVRDPGKYSKFSSRTLGRKSGFDAIIRDIVKLENQIPLFSLRETLEFQSGSSEEVEEMIYEMLTGLGREILPIRAIQDLPDFNQVIKCAHLLDFLYNLIAPKLDGSLDITSEAEKDDRNGGEKIINNFHKIIFYLRSFFSKPVKFFLSLPWKFVCNLPGLIMIKQMEYFCFSQEEGENNEPELNKNIEINNLHPLMEEIAIPSVTELSRAGVKFSVTNSGILGIKFDGETSTFYLPKITLDVNSEVVLRNLVAYEACSESGLLILTRYTELMNGIIDTDEDAKLLREEGIILNHLKSDQDVTNLWNGMTRSIRLTKVPFLDTLIEDANAYYNGRWRVRIGKIMNQHVFGSWRAITLLAAILLLFFVSSQTFCSIFRYAQLFVFSMKFIN